MCRHPLLLALTLLLATGAATPARALPVLRVASGLDQPVFATAPVGDERLFVVERGGTIRILDGPDHVLLPEPFLDLGDRVVVSGEGGLLGLAFAPDYATSRAFYVFYTVIGDTTPAVRISRFLASPTDPDVADASQEKVLLTVEGHASFEHLGGTVAFGADGMLYAGFGDGGFPGDVNESAQDPTTLLGKLIRIDVRFGGFEDDYAVPRSNPFVRDPGYRPEIWALGLRNPYRFSFDRETGDLYIGDVGESTLEEIDVERARSRGGRNYGWDVMEGTGCFEPPDPGEPPCNHPSLTLPVHEYGRSDGIAVTGGIVYRGSELPELVGRYVFSDFGSARIWSLEWDGNEGIVGSVIDHTEDTVPPEGAIEQVVGFGENGAGELYVVDLGGEVYRVPEPGQALLAAVGAALLGAARRRSSRSAQARRAATV